MKAGARSPPRRDAGRPRGPTIVDAVLSETLVELARNGLANLSVERIARAAEVNKSSVYRRWPTRAELVAAALDRVKLDLGARLRDTGSLRGDLLLLGQSIAAFLEQPVGQELARAAFDCAAKPEVPALAGASAPATAMVQRARERGELDPAVEPQMILGLLAGAVLHRKMLERTSPTDAWLGTIVDIILGGVQVKRPEPRPSIAKRP